MVKPRDLDFHPAIENQLWVLNQGDERYENNTENILSVCIEENSEMFFYYMILMVMEFVVKVEMVFIQF